jgi:hypothetical protein
VERAGAPSKKKADVKTVKKNNGERIGDKNTTLHTAYLKGYQIFLKSQVALTFRLISGRMGRCGFWKFAPRLAGIDSLNSQGFSQGTVTSWRLKRVV